MDGAGVPAVAANQDQSGRRFLLLQPVIMRGGLACVVIESHHIWPNNEFRRPIENRPTRTMTLKPHVEIIIV